MSTSDPNYLLLFLYCYLAIGIMYATVWFIIIIFSDSTKFRDEMLGWWDWPATFILFVIIWPYIAIKGLFQ